MPKGISTFLIELQPQKASSPMNSKDFGNSPISTSFAQILKAHDPFDSRPL